MLGMSLFMKEIQIKLFLHCCRHHGLMILTEKATSLVTEEIILLCTLHTEIHHQIVLMPNCFSKSGTFQKILLFLYFLAKESRKKLWGQAVSNRSAKPK